MILNEFGVLDFCVDAASRANWLRAVRQAAEANGIGWTYWEAYQGFGFIAGEHGGKDVFIHISVLELAGLRALNEGERVSMRVVETPKGREAISIDLG